MNEDALLDKIRDLKVAIVSHVYATGPAQELEIYLKDKAASLIFIGHPFKYAEDISSFCKIYKNSSLKRQSRARALRLPNLFMYFKDLFYTFFWLGSVKGKINIYFGVDPLNALAGIILKKLGKVNKVIFYMIDYAPKRFDNSLLNWIYHKIDSFCVTQSDFVWNLSERMTQERRKKGVNKTEHQMVVPIGVNFDKIERPESAGSNCSHLVYMGHLRKNQGLELIVTGFKRIAKEVPDARLVFIGGGELESTIKNKVEEEGLLDRVEFKGYIPDHSDVEKLLTKCGIGLALYEPGPDSFTRYSDPSKPKQYMACGLPVIITDVPWISKEVKSQELGIVVDCTRDSFVNAALKLLRDNKLYCKCRQNAIVFASRLRWDVIFSKALVQCV